MRSMSLGVLGAAALLACGFIVGCEDDNDDVIRMDSGLTDGGNDGPGADAAQLTDSQIATVMAAANAGEIQHGMIAQAKGQTSGVRSFAQMMVTMHSMANDRLTGVMQTAGLTSTQSTVSQMLQAEAQAIAQQLNSAPAAQFDSVYAQVQVTVHERVLQLLDSVLIPQADNVALKSDLQTSRGEVNMHLAMAKQLRDSLKNNGDGGAQDGSTGG